MADNRVPLAVRFHAKIEKIEDCWLWTGGHNSAGYGAIEADAPSTRTLLAHRVAYTLLVGPIPDGLELDHLCRNPGCVNPDHLEPVTHRENLRRSDLVTGKRSAKTHCPHGHPYDEVNTFYRPDRNRRECRTCNNERARRRRRQ